MRSLGILVFLLFWSGASYATTTSCSTSSFAFTAPTARSGEGKVEKKGCVLRFLTFLGKGEKLEVNVCRAGIEILEYPSILEPNPQILPAGSVNCPLPLFGADFSTHANSATEFEAAKARIRTILQEVKRRYLPPGKPSTSRAQKEAEANFACLEGTLKSYLDECEAQTWDENVKNR